MFYEYINMLHTRVSGAHGLVYRIRKKAFVKRWPDNGGQ